MIMVNSKQLEPFMHKLLSYATSESKVHQEYEKYLTCDDRILYKYESNDVIIGCIGIEIINNNACEIKHIAVSLSEREKGIGSKMINHISTKYQVIEAETDMDAVGFYRKIGFKITSLGQKYPGVERFLCEYKNN